MNAKARLEVSKIKATIDTQNAIIKEINARLGVDVRVLSESLVSYLDKALPYSYNYGVTGVVDELEEIVKLMQVEPSQVVSMMPLAFKNHKASMAKSCRYNIESRIAEFESCRKADLRY